MHVSLLSTMVVHFLVGIDTEYDRAKVPPYNGNDPPPAPGNLKRSLFPTLLNEVQNQGTQGVRARYGAELPPIISIVRYPGRPVILGMEGSVHDIGAVLCCFLPRTALKFTCLDKHQGAWCPWRRHGRSSFLLRCCLHVGRISRIGQVYPWRQ